MKTAKMTALFWILFGLALAAAALFPLASQAGEAGHPGYVVLGDSIDFGVGSSTGEGYVVGFSRYLGGTVFGPTLDLHNLSEPGATTRDINLEQLAPAIAEIQNHRPQGVVVSWGGGGNDLLEFIQSPQAATCLRLRSCLSRLNALLNEVEQDVDLALKALRFFAGPESTILVRTQYNSLRKSGCAPADRVALGDAALEGAPGTLVARGLNDRLRALAARHGAKVVEIFLPFALDPDRLIGSDCIHPTDAGYEVILGLFISAFETP